MAKIGYIMVTARYDKADADRNWMKDFGCIQVIEENDQNENGTKERIQ